QGAHGHEHFDGESSQRAHRPGLLRVRPCALRGGQAPPDRRPDGRPHRIDDRRAPDRAHRSIHSVSGLVPEQHFRAGRAPALSFRACFLRSRPEPDSEKLSMQFKRYFLAVFLMLLFVSAGCSRAVSVGSEPSNYAVDVTNRTSTAVDVYWSTG